MTLTVGFQQESGRDGFALPAVLLALLLVAALVAGAFSATTEETRIGAAAESRQVALVTAESAIEITLTALSSGNDTIGVGETRSRPIAGLDARVVVYITRLDSSLYWLVADARSASPNSGIARRVGVMVRATNDPAHSISINRISERAWSELF